MRDEIAPIEAVAIGLPCMLIKNSNLLSDKLVRITVNYRVAVSRTGTRCGKLLSQSAHFAIPCTERKSANRSIENVSHKLSTACSHVMMYKWNILFGFSE